MNWILLGVIVLLAHKEYYGTFFGMASPSPLRMPGYTQHLSPFIRHWEAANFDRWQLHAAHQKHIEQKRHRRKRDLHSGEYGPSHTIRLSFFAHDREFRLVLRQDPLSVFATDVEIENTLGPTDYDISRIYTGSLEDDENSHVHAILTSDNLLDGTIETSSEQFYVEPSHRYSRDLSASGVHSIVYKLSDVNMPSTSPSALPIATKSESAAAGSNSPSSSSSSSSSSPQSVSSSHSGAATEHCASERLRRSMLLDDLKRRKRMQVKSPSLSLSLSLSSSSTVLKDIFLQRDDNSNKVDNSNDVSISHNRRKRWLPDEQQQQSTDDRNPPLPLDLDVPYNDDYSILSHDNSREDVSRTSSSDNNDSTRPPERTSDTHDSNWRNSMPTYTRNRNIIVSNYNPPNSDTSNNNNNNNNNTYNNYNGVRKTYTKHKNILVSSFSNRSLDDSSAAASDSNFINNFFNTNWTTMFGSSSSSSSNSGSSRPSHKTHVELITKNGAAKKPNIIVNNYNPDVVMSQNFNGMLSSRQDLHESGSNAAARAMYDRKITCMLYLQADHTFFQKMGSDESSIEAITRHVQRANSIYKNTDFNGDGKADNITFMIKRIKVHNANALKDPGYRFPGNYGVEKFLELFSEEDYDAFCLAYMFTYRDFEMGTLGLAWTGDLKNAGGVCEKNGHYRGSLKSLNTGIVTLLNYGKHVPPAVSHVTLAHEIGHNFGSPHDPEQCTPGGEDGNYIMFARATSGDKRNNNKFSPCSLKSIEPVLNAKARSVKGCFTEPQTSICGNGVVEPGEQCDCGWEEDCKDSCCFPMSRHPRPNEKPCTLTPRAMCSPSQGPCCTTDCKLKFGDKCRDDNGCRDPSFCDGRMPQCPPSVNKPNKTICNKEFVCYMGECTGSICLAYGLESCQCIPGPGDPKTKSCELCCKQPGEGQSCRSSFEWNEPPFDVPDMFAKPGTPCNDYNGYCDVFQKCREVDPSGPLATLRKLLLSEESIASFKRWIQTNWYTVVLAVVGVFLLLILSTKLLAKRSNLKLKSVTIIHSATTETVRLPEDNNGVIVHTAVRTKVPFKKKVRGERSVKTKIISKSTSGMPASNQKSQNIFNSKHQRDAVLKKPQRKKNRVAVPGITTNPLPPPIAVTTNTTTTEDAPVLMKNSDSKLKSKGKSSKKHKEIIDYSNRMPPSGHTNTFGKVHKWLLESPIVSQPLSHIEHSSKVRKVMSKSQSTPERLVQKSPQKSKSVGNLSNEKVKLQVVYKPPFKFSLRLSKNSAVKTHVIGSGLNKMKRKVRSNDKKRVNAATTAVPDKVERSKRSAILLRRHVEEESQVLTNSEPNYETLNPKQPLPPMPADSPPLYENMLPNRDGSLQSNSLTRDLKPSTSKSSGRISRSSSNTNLNAAPSQPHSYSRSNSISNQSTAAKHPASRKYSDNSVHLSRNFGSTQNLIHPSSSQTNLSKSKKRSSLNLKTSSSTAAAGNLQMPTKRSNSNLNLRRENHTTNDTKTPSPQQPPPPTQPPLKRTSSNSTQPVVPPPSLPIPPPHRGSITRGSFSNIPRASLNIAANFQRQASTPAASASSNSTQPSCSSNTSNSFNSFSNHHSSSNNRPHTAACDDANPNSKPRPFEWLQPSGPSSHSNGSNVSSQDQIRRGSRSSASSGHHHQLQQQQQLPSDLEVMVSDVENLVS